MATDSDSTGKTLKVAPRVFEDVCQQIREQLAAGTLKAGDKLPAEREMAEKLQVGRNAIREALRSLEQAGVIRLEKGRSGGAYIRPPNASRITGAMQDLLDYGSIDLGELTEARLMIMDMITRLACERGRDADFDLIEHNIDRTDEVTKAGLLEQRAELAAEFYTLLARGTRNSVLVLLVTSLSQIFRRLFLIRLQGGGTPMASVVTSRRRILRFLRARDADRACAELRSQMLAGQTAIQAYLSRKPAPTQAPVARPIGAKAKAAAAARAGGQP